MHRRMAGGWIAVVLASLACAGGGSTGKAACEEGVKTCLPGPGQGGDLYDCVGGRPKRIEDCDDAFGCTVTATGFEGQAMCAWGGG